MKMNRYEKIILDIFERKYSGEEEFEFGRSDLAESCRRLGVEPPKNLGDVIYAFRYRLALPQAILDTQPPDRCWLILGAGDANYRFRLGRLANIAPSKGMMVRKIPDATPDIISKYAFSDEQALLARIRYNRLVDIFLGIAAYSLQNHLRTRVANYGQIEIDELYIGVDGDGAQYVVPVQAKGRNDRLGVIQTIQDTMFCKTEKRYRHCIIRPVSAQFIADDRIAMFELRFDGNDVEIVNERHYRLAEAGEITGEDLDAYRIPRT